MSLHRLIFYGAVLGGWAAFVGWLLAELLFAGGERSRGFFAAVLLAAFVGAAIAGALAVLPAVANGQWRQGLRRLGPGLLGGFLAGLVGALIGNGFYRLLSVAAGSDTGAVRFFGLIPGWILMGLAIGAVEGVYDRSPRKLRNGLIGGAVGGLLGGLLFDPLAALMQSGTGMASRATAFVILGLCIGLFIAVVQVVLKQAWLTVVDGFRPGRQLILTEPETEMGTSEKVALPFIAFGAKGVEPRHVRILRQPDGSYVVFDNNTRGGTRVNGHPLTAPVRLRDGDVIAFGVNMVRFSEHRRTGGPEPVAPVPVRPAVVPVTVLPAVVTPVAVQARPTPAPVVTPVVVPVHPVAPPQPQAPARPAGASDLCPNCGIKAPGAPGSRVCMICGQTF